MGVLLVEDDDALGATMKLALERAGHTVDWTPNNRGAEAAARAQSYAAIPPDLSLRGTFGGADRVRALRDARDRTPIILVTARDARDEKLRLPEERGYVPSVTRKGAYFRAGLRDLQARWSQIGDVDGLGLALRCEMCKADGYTPNKPLLDRMTEEGLKGDLTVGGAGHGLVLDVGGWHKNVIAIAPSLHARSGPAMNGATRGSTGARRRWRAARSAWTVARPRGTGASASRSLALEDSL